MTKRRRLEQTAPNGLQPFLAWADSYRKVSKWFARYDLENLLAEHNGLVQLPGFLPAHVAEGALSILQQLPEVMHYVSWCARRNSL